MTRILITCLIGVAAVAGIFGYGYFMGQQAGTREIQAQWDNDKRRAQEVHDELVQKLAKQESIHATYQEQTALELAQERNRFSLALVAQRNVYQRRLLQSTRRGEVYRAQAEASPDSCRDLAGHAAELDRALEEGRGLVRELGETLGLRERQVILLGKQIQTDRKLFQPEEGASP